MGISDYELHWKSGNWRDLATGIGLGWEQRLKIDTKPRPSHDGTNIAMQNTSPSNKV